eukprot:6177048-Pleurochrysis_carterae.AAC.12
MMPLNAATSRHLPCNSSSRPLLALLFVNSSFVSGSKLHLSFKHHGDMYMRALAVGRACARLGRRSAPRRRAGAARHTPPPPPSHQGALLGCGCGTYSIRNV